MRSTSLIQTNGSTYCLPKCPDTLKEELAEKISQYTSAGWWIPTMVQQAIPMLYVLKKNGKLWTVFNLHMQNDNKDTIQHDIACAIYRSKLGYCQRHTNKYMFVQKMSWRLLSTTIFSTFMSLVMQAGWLQCSIYLSEVDDCGILWIHRTFHTCISRWYIHILLVYQGAWETTSDWCLTGCVMHSYT